MEEILKKLGFIALLSIGWTLQIRDTHTNTVLINIKEPNSNLWAMEMSLNSGLSWTWCSYTTGTLYSVMYKNPPNALFRARLLP